MKPGPQFEKDVVEFLRANGFPAAERRVMGGVNDKGDIAGVPGWVIETKRLTSSELGEGMKEAEREARNAGVSRFAYVKKRRQKGTRDAYAIVPLWLLVELMREAAWHPHEPISDAEYRAFHTLAAGYPPEDAS